MGCFQSKERIVDDSDWPEVQLINNFSLFMGYLLMAVRGLGFLVLTWTTVVLLGGYVSALSTKDFWFLTVIILVQTAGVFDASLTQKLDYIWRSLWVFPGLVIITFQKVEEKIDTALANLEQNETLRAAVSALVCVIVLIIRLLVEVAAALLQMLLSVIILCPLAFLYVFGLYISAGLSLLRLIQRDYGDQANEGHLKSALDVLYSLSVLQGAVFSYRWILRFQRQGLVKRVAKLYGLHDKTLKQSPVWEYMVETKAGCGKDPSFVKERNLITYAMELMQSNNGPEAPDKYTSGLRILGSTLNERKRANGHLEGQQTLIKHLIGSRSSSQLLLKLLHTLDPRSLYGTVSRLHAARIVAILADEIRLSQFPGTIQWIASLLDACQHQDDNDSAVSAGEYNQLMEQGLLILRGLATDEDNCKIILSTHGLLSKIMMPTASDLLHRIDHVEWIHDMINMSLSVISQLAAAPGNTGKELRSKVSMNKEAINSMETILGCSVCATTNPKSVTNLKSAILAMKILKQLDNRSSPSIDAERTGNFLKRLTGIFTTVDLDISIRRSTAEELLIYLPSKRNAMVILESNDGVLHVLTQLLLDVSKDTCHTSHIIIAAQILEHLSVHYPKDGDHVNNLKEAMIDVMPKVLRKILSCESKEKAVQAETEANNKVSLWGPRPRDIEKQNIIPQDNAQNIISSSNRQQDDEQIEDRTLLAALLSLCVVICDTFICVDQDLAHKLALIASGGSSPSSLLRKLKEMVKRDKQPKDNTISLKIIKLTCKMVTLIMKHNCWYNIKDMESLVQSLSDASSEMLGAESLMFMANTDNGTVKPTCATLASLVKEAQELLNKKKAEETEMEASAS